MTSSNSMPQMIHMLAAEEKASGHVRKHSNSFQGVLDDHDHDSFDDSTEELPTYTMENAMPPPPPPPLEWNGDEDLCMLTG